MRIDGMEEHAAVRRQVRAPELCRLTILAQRTQVDLAVPVNVPLALLIPGIVDMVDTHMRNNDFRDQGSDGSFQPREWVLARIGQPPLSTSLSIGELGVRDGEILMLESADHTAPPPLFDDIMYNVAMADADRYRRWTPAVARIIGTVFAGVATAAGCFALLWQGVGHNSLISAIVAVFLALVLLVSGVVMSRVYGDEKAALVLCGLALPVAFTAGALVPPGGWSWSQILVGAAMVGAVALLSLRMAGVGLALFTGAAMIAVFTIPAAIFGMFVNQPVRVITSVMAALALGALAMAPRLSMLLARLPLPPVPTAGSSIDPTEADPSDQHSMPGFDELNAKARRAHQYLAGLVAGSTILAVGGALASAAPVKSAVGPTGGIYWQGAILAIIVAIVLMFRGRTYANAEEAMVLFAGGIVIVVALLVGGGVVSGTALGIFLAAMAIGIAALAVGFIIPRQTATPPMRRFMELLEYGFVAAVVPLVCWVANLYSTMRGL